MKNILLILLLCFSFTAFSQETQYSKEEKHEFKIGIEILPRTEYLNGFGTMPKKEQETSFRTMQRSRIKGGFNYNDELIVHASFQDVRTWGNQHHSNMQGATSVFLQEGWFEYFLSKENNLSMKFGRQVIAYDNDRIFGTLDWALQGRSHDAFLLKYEQPNNLKLHYGIAYNTGNKAIGANYDGFNSYVFMSYLWINKKIDDLRTSVLLLDNGTKQLKNNSGFNVNHGFTAGTHIEYGKKDDMFKPYTYFYYQFGDITVGDSIKRKQNAFNFAIGSDIDFNNNFGIGVNFEMLSGTDRGNSTSGTFNPLFGTNHKFNGFMDYFYVGSNGNITSYGLNDVWGRIKFSESKFLATLDFHYFMTNKDPYNILSGKLEKYLGFEIDLQCSYTLNKYAKIVGGYSQMFGSDTMETFTGGYKNEIANWAWVQFVINADIFLN